MPIEEDSIKKKGLTSRISVMCSCGYVKEEYTSETIVVYSNSSKRDDAFRSKYSHGICFTRVAWIACRIGKLQMTVVNFDNISNKIRDFAKFIADLTMHNAANEMRKRSSHMVDVGLTVDGTW